MSLSDERQSAFLRSAGVPDSHNYSEQTAAADRRGGPQAHLRGARPRPPGAPREPRQGRGARGPAARDRGHRGGGHGADPRPEGDRDVRRCSTRSTRKWSAPAATSRSRLRRARARSTRPTTRPHLGAPAAWPSGLAAARRALRRSPCLLALQARRFSLRQRRPPSGRNASQLLESHRRSPPWRTGSERATSRERRCSRRV